MLSPEEEKKLRYFLKVTLPNILARLDAIEHSLEEIRWAKASQKEIKTSDEG